jgi:hypothetical protein
MDKIKIFLAAAKKHQFWVCCGVMLLTSLGCWWWACGNLSDLFKTRASQIDGAFTAAEVKPGAANQGVIDAITKIDPTTQQDSGDLGRLKQKVYRAWESLYARQKEKNLFPTEIFRDDFRKAFEKLQLPKGELDPMFLEIYRNHAKECVPPLQKIVKVRHEVGGEGATPAGPIPPPRRMPPGGGGQGYPPGIGGGRGGVMMPGGGIGPGGGTMRPPPRTPTGIPVDTGKEYTGIVDWDAGDFAQVAGHFDWEGRTPTTLEVVLSQEDLWVYETLLGIIKKVNEGATSQANATIKQILALQIGRDAAPAWAEARGAVFAGAAKAGPGPGPGGMPPPGMMPGRGGPGPGPAGDGAEPSLFNNRYVDEKGQPLPYEAEYPHAKHPVPEFKMMPICLNLIMDQRRLPSLLVECANSHMPIEVRQVRILKETIPPFEPSAPAAGGGGAAPGMPRPGPGPAAGHRPGVAGVASQDASGQADVPVQVYAIIYIYNPPDRAKLGIPEEKTPAVPAPPAGATAPPSHAPAPRPSPATTPGR